jgi:hypothetical protein
MRKMYKRVSTAGADEWIAGRVRRAAEEAGRDPPRLRCCAVRPRTSATTSPMRASRCAGFPRWSPTTETCPCSCLAPWASCHLAATPSRTPIGDQVPGPLGSPGIGDLPPDEGVASLLRDLHVPRRLLRPSRPSWTRWKRRQTTRLFHLTTPLHEVVLGQLLLHHLASDVLTQLSSVTEERAARASVYSARRRNGLDARQMW